MKKYFALLFIVLLLISLLGCDFFTSETPEDYKKNHPSAFQVVTMICDISPDNNSILFTNGSPYWSKIGTYSLKTGAVKILSDKENNKMNLMPSFSSDGATIVFISAKERDYARNIFIMNADGSDLRQITRHPEIMSKDIIHASNPSFSPDGERIIFRRSQKIRERAFPLRGQMNCDWDIYEVEVATGIERRLTNCNFYEIHPPFYMSDGKRFIFSGEGPYNPKGKGPKNFKEYEEKYKKNFVFIMDGKNNEIKPAFMNGSHSVGPHVSNDGKIIFLSKTNEMDGIKNSRDTQDIFIYKRGKINRLTKSNSYLAGARISRDGQFILFTKRNEEHSRDWVFSIMKSDGTCVKEIKIPIIN